MHSFSFSRPCFFHSMVPDMPRTRVQVKKISTCANSEFLGRDQSRIVTERDPCFDTACKLSLRLEVGASSLRPRGIRIPRKAKTAFSSAVKTLQ